MKPSSAKQKGRHHQNWVRDHLLKLFPDLTIHDVKGASMGANGIDILLSTQARKRFPYAVECKSVAQAAIYKMYDQSSANAIKDATDKWGYFDKEKMLEPIVVIRQNRRRPLAVIDFEVFADMVKDRWNIQKSTDDTT